jgi:hypothetical protein
MATTLTTQLRLAIQGVLTDEAGNYNLNPSIQALMQNGFALDQCDLVHSKQYSINSAGATTLNLADGSLKMPNGNSAAFVKVALFFAVNLSPDVSTTQIISVGGGTNTLAWLPNSQLVGGPRAAIVKYNPALAGLAVTPSTAMNLVISAAAGSAVPVTIFIAGRSA